MVNLLLKRSTLWLVLLALLAASLTFRIADRPGPASALTATNDSGPLEPPSPALGETSKPLSDMLVEYHISVQLDAENKRLLGAQAVTWKNPGARPVNELYFHLYPNAFQSKKTTFMRESGGKLRQDEMAADSFGRMTIDTIATENGVDLLSTITFVQPDDGNRQDQTLMKIRLPQPVPPGGETTVKLGFTVELPQVFARMGYAGDFVMAGQWFPKLAVYEKKGTRGREEEGWSVHQYHGNSEFYANFGMFNVKIQVPAGYTVAATGFPIRPAAEDGDQKTYQFYADDVHDFAWAASPHFIYVEEPFSSAKVPGVKIKLYLDPAHEALKDRYLYVAKRSLAKYSEWFGPYPYSTLSIVVPPAGGNGAGGMEYPTLVTGWDAAGSTEGFELERVITHEIGHQYWYGMVASNEFEEAWLDEGFTSYAEDWLMSSEFGSEPDYALEASYITDPQPLRQSSWLYGDHGRYADNVYLRAKLVLAGIEQQIGRQQMQKVLKTYFERWKFKHPATSDFQSVLESVTSKSWSDYFDQFVYGGLMTDYAVTHIQTKPIQQDGASAYENTVRIEKNGGHYMDVPLRFHFADGSVVDQSWEGRESHVRITLTSASPLTWAAVDPERTMVLETKRNNNFLQVEIDTSWNVRWQVGIVKLIETLLGRIAW